MDYLVIEGYKNAAERFSLETGLNPQVDLESIENRMIIRSAIQRGDVEDAIGRVNELDPEVSVVRYGARATKLLRDLVMMYIYTCTTLRPRHMLSPGRCGFVITNFLSEHPICLCQTMRRRN